MESIGFAVNGTNLRAVRFGRGPHAVLAAHGITASAMSWATVGRGLPDGWQLVAVDMRGRGGSAAAPGPFGMDQHAADLVAIVELLGPPVVLTGVSMGAYAALRAAVTRPELFSRLVLVDGGLPLPVPPGVGSDQVLAAVVGPALARLSMTFATPDEYIDFFRAHPALVNAWNEDLEAYVRYDIAGEPGSVRSKVNSDAVAADGADMVGNIERFGLDLIALRAPTKLLHAPRGMLGAEPGLLPQPLVDHWASAAPALSAELIEDTNHYTILTNSHSAQRIVSALISV